MRTMINIEIQNEVSLTIDLVLMQMSLTKYNLGPGISFNLDSIILYKPIRDISNGTLSSGDIMSPDIAIEFELHANTESNLSSASMKPEEKNSILKF